MKNDQFYHLLLWTPFELRHYRDLDQIYRDKLKNYMINLDGDSLGSKSNVDIYERDLIKWYVEPKTSFKNELSDQLSKAGKPIEIVGYSGTGKTTTLYVSLLRHINELRTSGLASEGRVFDVLIQGQSYPDNIWKTWLDLKGDAAVLRTILTLLGACAKSFSQNYWA